MLELMKNLEVYYYQIYLENVFVQELGGKEQEKSRDLLYFYLNHFDIYLDVYFDIYFNTYLDVYLDVYLDQLDKSFEKQ